MHQPNGREELCEQYLVALTQSTQVKDISMKK